MNDDLGLYRIENDFDHCQVCDAPSMVPVEPVLIVKDDWTPVDSLPEGYTYAVVRLDYE
jgi:hypothetical protein